MKRLLKALACAAGAMPALATCSPHGTASNDERNVSQKQFSAEDKRAALALSIGQQSALVTAQSPYQRALLCVVSMDALSKRILGATGLTEPQREALALAGRHFEAQLRTVAKDAGKSDGNVKTDLEQTVRDHPDESENARVAIACQQQLQG